MHCQHTHIDTADTVNIQILHIIPYRTHLNVLYEHIHTDSADISYKHCHHINIYAADIADTA